VLWKKGIQYICGLSIQLDALYLMKGNEMEPSERVNDYDKKKAAKKALTIVLIKHLIMAIDTGLEGARSNNNTMVAQAANDIYEIGTELEQVEWC